MVNAAPDNVRAEETLWRVRELLGEMKGLENIDLVSLLDGDDPRGIEAALDALENGGRAFDEFDFLIAERSLSQALMGLAGWSQYREQAINAGVLLARTYAAQGKGKQLGRVWGPRTLDSAQHRTQRPNFSPSFRQVSFRHGSV